MKTKCTKLMLSLLLIGTMTGCGSAGNEDESFDIDGDITEDVTISFFGWGSKEEQENFQELCDEFMKQEPHVKVAYSATGSDQYMNVLTSKANSLPDVFYMPDYDFMEWADSGKLLPLDNYVTEDEINSMWKMSTEMYRYDAETYTLGQGKLLGLPKDLGPYTLVYNKTLLKQCLEENNKWVDEATSLPSGQNPMSWEQFTSYLSDLKRPGVYPIGYYELMCAVYSNNANFFDDEVKKERITEDNFIDAIQWIADLTKNGLAPKADEQSEQDSFQRWLTSKCVFTFMGPWDMATFWKTATDFEFDIVPVPYGPAEGAKSTTWVGSVAYCVSKESKYKQAAVKFAKFLACSEKSSEMNYKLGQAVPNIIEYAKNQFVPGVGYNEVQKKSPTNRQLFIDIIEGNDTLQVYGKQRAKYYLYVNTAYDDLGTKLNDVYTGKKTAREVLTAYAKTFQKGLDDANDNKN